MAAMKELVIQSVGINDIDLEQYGRVIGRKPGQQPDSRGKGFQCWYPLGMLPSEKNLQIGLVQADLAEAVIEKMESHPTRQEWVYAIDAPIIQVVALTGESGCRADASTARAILLHPGEGILIQAGVWHAPAFAASLEKVYYGFVLASADPDIKEEGLVPFEGEFQVRIGH